MRCSITLFTVGLILMLAPWAAAQTANPAYHPRQVLKTPMRAITEPVIVGAKASTISPNELVLGVFLHGQARAYRIYELTGPQREVINDRLGGIPIAATW